MPTLLGAAALALGGLVLARVLRREWRRVNAELESRRTPPAAPAPDAPRRLERDPETGRYRPAKD